MTEAVTLSSLRYAPFEEGQAATLSGSATVTLAADSVIEVTEGQVLVVTAPVVLAGKVRKTGFGRVVFAGPVTGDTGLLDVENGAADIRDVFADSIGITVRANSSLMGTATFGSSVAFEDGATVNVYHAHQNAVHCEADQTHNNIAGPVWIGAGATLRAGVSWNTWQTKDGASIKGTEWDAQHLWITGPISGPGSLEIFGGSAGSGGAWGGEVYVGCPTNSYTGQTFLRYSDSYPTRTVKLARIWLEREQPVVLADVDSMKSDLQQQVNAQEIAALTKELCKKVTVVYPHGTNFWNEVK